MNVPDHEAAARSQDAPRLGEGTRDVVQTFEHLHRHRLSTVPSSSGSALALPSIRRTLARSPQRRPARRASRCWVPGRSLAVDPPPCQLQGEQARAAADVEDALGW